MDEMKLHSFQIPDHFVTELPVFEDGSRRQWVKSHLEMDTDATSFRGGRLKLKCVANVFSSYVTTSEIQIEEEKPRSASVLGSKDSTDEIPLPPPPGSYLHF